MTDENALLDVLKQLLAKQLPGLKPEFIDVDASILEDGLGLDSLMLVELIVSVEQHFGFSFAEMELSMETFASLRALANCIENRINFSPAGS